MILTTQNNYVCLKLFSLTNTRVHICICAQFYFNNFDFTAFIGLNLMLLHIFQVKQSL